MLTPILACFLLCGQQVRVSVSALAAPDAHSQTRFLVMPGNPGTPVSDLQFQEYATEVGRALVARGFEQAKSIEDVTLVVMMSWSISEPRTKIISGTTSGFERVGTDKDPDTGLEHTRTKFVTRPTQDTQIYFTRSIDLKAFDQPAFKQTNAPKELWEITLRSDGSQSDLRTVFPVIVAAAQPYLGESTKQAIDAFVAADDVKVKYIRGEITALPAKK